jgi:hypothetical protein
MTATQEMAVARVKELELSIMERVKLRDDTIRLEKAQCASECRAMRHELKECRIIAGIAAKEDIE